MIDGERYRVWWYTILIVHYCNPRLGSPPSNHILAKLNACLPDAGSIDRGAHGVTVKRENRYFGRLEQKVISHLDRQGGTCRQQYTAEASSEVT